MASRALKCVVVGDGAVGKTCMLMSYAHNQFPEEHVPTVFDNYLANVMFGSEIISLSLWDTAGQEDFDSLRSHSFPNTDIFIICFAVTRPSSLQNVKDKWILELRNYHQQKNIPMPPILLVGTKVDQREDPEVVRQLSKNGESVLTPEQGQAVANEIKANGYEECSAKTTKGLKGVFDKVTTLALRKDNSDRKGTSGEKGSCVLL